jgi:hypothetical protein
MLMFHSNPPLVFVEDKDRRPVLARSVQYSIARCETSVRLPMTMQRLCHLPITVVLAGIAGLLATTGTVHGDPDVGESPANNYPTQARVEYVNECVARNGNKLSDLYKCSCVIDRVAQSLSYDDFVEASTFARYSTLPGEGGGIFRDSDQARKLAKQYRDLERDAYKACGLAR